MRSTPSVPPNLAGLNLRARLALGALAGQSLYLGTVSDNDKAKRRAKSKAARKSRRINRKAGR